MRGRGQWLGLAVLACLLLGPVVGLSLYLDSRGVTAPGEVVEKRETISVSARQYGHSPGELDFLFYLMVPTRG
jgi:hypothetical protein